MHYSNHCTFFVVKKARSIGVPLIQIGRGFCQRPTIFQKNRHKPPATPIVPDKQRCARQAASPLKVGRIAGRRFIAVSSQTNGQEHRLNAQIADQAATEDPAPTKALLDKTDMANQARWLAPNG